MLWFEYAYANVYEIYQTLMVMYTVFNNRFIQNVPLFYCNDFIYVHKRIFYEKLINQFIV